MPGGSTPGKAVPKRRCLFCRTEFDLTRSDRVFCSAGCRKRAFGLRKEAGAVPARARLCAEAVQEEIDRARAVTSGPPITAARYLQELAGVREAEEMAKLWALRLGARRTRLQRLADPGLAVRLQVVRAAQEVLPPLPEEEQLGVACASAELAVVAYGRRR
jgi:hypothetical protein